jgi:AcrR family transcriptional regulator
MTTDAGWRRQQQLLTAAARLFAGRGYHGVTIEDLGSEVGVTGPALYRHFASKDALLGALLVGASQRLHAVAVEITSRGLSAAATMSALIAAHVRFAVGNPDVIRVQDRDLASLGDDQRRQVRRLQRQYVEMWETALCELRVDLPARDARAMVHAAFGLMNSTPYSSLGQSKHRMRKLLEDMCSAALTAPNGSA